MSASPISTSNPDSRRLNRCLQRRRQTTATLQRTATPKWQKYPDSHSDITAGYRGRCYCYSKLECLGGR